ncbi:unnamed protein product [Lactuca saligna]|uniref:Uncharacterized protein n=1 Tax=Lactuca saligna TaxID=75948 RepID=A0AA35VM00_LACSI|nr:unnamed protein product [Lactuca saligna]
MVMTASRLHLSDPSSSYLALIKAEWDELKARLLELEGDKQSFEERYDLLAGRKWLVCLLVWRMANRRFGSKLPSESFSMELASYLCPGELDIGGLRQLCDDSDTEEDQPEGGSSHAGASSTPQSSFWAEELGCDYLMPSWGGSLYKLQTLMIVVSLLSTSSFLGQLPTLTALALAILWLCFWLSSVTLNVCYLVSSFSMLCALDARRHVGMLCDFQPSLAFVLTILHVSGVVTLLLSSPSPTGCSFGVGILSSLLGCGYLFVFLLTVWVVIILLHRILGMSMIAQAAIARSGFAYVFKAVTVAKLLVVLNFIVPCNFDGMTYSRKRTGSPRIISSSDLFLTTDNSIVLVTHSFPSWVSSVNGRLMVPRGHNLCHVKPMSGALVGVYPRGPEHTCPSGGMSLFTRRCFCVRQDLSCRCTLGCSCVGSWVLHRPSPRVCGMDGCTLVHTRNDTRGCTWPLEAYTMPVWSMRASADSAANLTSLDLYMNTSWIVVVVQIAIYTIWCSSGKTDDLQVVQLIEWCQGTRRAVVVVVVGCSVEMGNGCHRLVMNSVAGSNGFVTSICVSGYPSGVDGQLPSRNCIGLT